MYRRNDGFDTILIGPSAQALKEALRVAEKAANLRFRNAQVHVDDKAAKQLWRKMARAREGYLQWLGTITLPQRKDERSAIAVAWWSDRLNRRHVRVHGARWSFTYGQDGIDHVLCPHCEIRPPLWMIYPEYTYLAEADAEDRLLAVCACGAAGSIDDIGWMGDCCSTCHDQRERGLPTVQPTVLQSPLSRSWSSLGDRMAFSADGRWLAHVTADAIVVIHDLANSQTLQWQLRSDEKPALETPDLAFLPDCRTIALTGDQSVLLLDIETGNRLPGPPAGKFLERLTASPDGSLVAVTTSPDRFSVWDMSTNEQIFEISSKSRGPEILCAAFSPDGKRLIGGCADGTTRVWNVSKFREVAVWDAGPDCHGRIQELAISYDGRLLATLANRQESNLLLRDARTGEVRTRLTLERKGYHPRSWLRMIAFSPDSRTLVGSEYEWALKFIDVEEGFCVRIVSGPKPEIMSVAFQPGGRWLATSSSRDGIKLWAWEELVAAARR